MRRLTWLVCALGACFAKLIAEQPASFLGPHPEEVHLRHIEPKGLGYEQGYSSIDLFLTLPQIQRPFLPFLDLRGHCFNGGKCAANAGVGFRYLSNPLARVFGVNAFYDYRATQKRHYNQVSMGVEALGKSWDFRASGYALISGKKSRPYNFEFNLDTFLLTARREYALSGFDAEAGYHLPEFKWVNLYTAAGPYFYTSEKLHRSTTGGRLRALIALTSSITVEGVLSYDHLFKWIGQGAISLNIPFGARKRIAKEECALNQRLFQPVWHNEMIVVKKERKKL